MQKHARRSQGCLMRNHKGLINKQLNCLLEYAKENSASDHIMFLLNAQVSHVREQVNDALDELVEQREAAISTIGSLFEQRKLAKEQIDHAVKDMVRGYLRRCMSGGMPSKRANDVQAAIDAMCDLGMFADLFARYKNS